MANELLFRYKIRNPLAESNDANNYWITIGSCYWDSSDINSAPFFLLNNTAEPPKEEEEPEKEPVYYTVTFNANGHGTAPESQTILENTRAIEPSESPTEEGWTFEGWCLDEDGRYSWNFYLPVTDNIILYAKWIEEGSEPEPQTNPTPSQSDADYIFTLIQSQINNLIKKQIEDLTPSTPSTPQDTTFTKKVQQDFRSISKIKGDSTSYVYWGLSI